MHKTASFANSKRVGGGWGLRSGLVETFSKPIQNMKRYTESNLNAYMYVLFSF